MEELKNQSEVVKPEITTEQGDPAVYFQKALEDLKTYIDFYSSSKGQKLIISITAVLQESVQVSVDYLKEKFPEMVEKQ